MSNIYKNNIIYVIFIIAIMKFFNTPYNIYSILKFDYSNRMAQTYGICGNESWGFYDSVIKKFDFRNQEARIINFGGYVIIDSLFKNINQTGNIKSKFLMVLNYQNKIDEDIYDSKIENIKKYYIKYKFENCYLLELND